MILFTYGFRPFFLLASVLASASVATWVWSGEAPLSRGVYPAPLLHAHDLLFGYVSAVIAGFLLTAAPSWTRRSPVSGWGLAALAGLWLAGRLAMHLPYFGGLANAVIEASFLPVLGMVVLRELILARNWRNVIVVAAVFVLAAANASFHHAALTDGDPDAAKRLALSAVAFLIALIGGRIIPAFTRNWLARRERRHAPVQPNRFDQVALVATAIGFAAWSYAPTGLATAALLAAAAILQAARFIRWSGFETILNPLLFVLHVAYGTLPIGMALLAASASTDVRAVYVAGIHLIGVGCVGGMTLAVMTRASLGHTGRALASPPLMTAAFIAVFGAAALRVAAALRPDFAETALQASGLLWIASFGAFLIKIGPMLFQKRL